jgi:hypothetical protein
MLFHKDIGFPANFTKPTGRVPLYWSGHAREAAEQDRYGIVPQFKTMTLDRCEVIEIEVVCNRVVKMVLRARIDNERDACIAVIPAKETAWVVKTVWVNLHTDAHRTLDRSRYATP